MVLREVLLLIILTYVGVSSKDFNVTYGKLFPLYENEDFFMTIKKDRTQFLFYTAIIFKFDLDGFEKQRIVVSPTFMKDLQEPIYGPYFSVENYHVDEDSQVHLQLRFRREADRNSIEVYFVPAANRTMRKEVSKNLANYPQYLLSKMNISLNLHWSLTLTQKTVDHFFGGLVHGQRGLITCSAKGGYPKADAKILGLENLRVVSTEFNKEKNIHIAEIEGQITDHNREIGCSANDDIIHDRLKIYHHPTTLSMNPSIEGFMKNGSMVLCLAKDGHPRPRPKWFFNEGPTNATNYFQIDNKHSILNMKPNAPLGSQWRFTCEARNTIANSVDKGAAMSVSFIIGEKPVSVIIIAGCVSSIVVGLVFLIVIVFLVRRKCTKDRRIAKREHSVVLSEMKYATAMKEPLYRPAQQQSPRVPLVSAPLYARGPIDEV